MELDDLDEEIETEESKSYMVTAVLTFRHCMELPNEDAAENRFMAEFPTGWPGELVDTSFDVEPY